MTPPAAPRRLPGLLPALMAALLCAALSACALATGGGLTWPKAGPFPRFAPIHTLWVLDAPSNTPAATLAALATLQGLVNRPRPRLYVVANADDTFWMQHALPGVATRTLTMPANCAPAQPKSLTYKALQASAQESSVEMLCAVLRRFPHTVRGLVIYDPALPATLDVATTMAGIDRGVAVTPALAATLEGAPYHLRVLADLRTHHWTTADQAYSWAFAHLWPHATHRLLFSLDPSIALNLREYAVATRGFVFWLDPRNGADRTILGRILAAAEPDAPILGWWTNEPAGVAMGSSYGHTTIATDFCDNLSVFGAFPPVPALHQSAPPALPSATPGPGVYYSIEFSDGDNMQFMQHRLRQLWQDPLRAQEPAAYTVQPWAGQAMPTILEYFYRTASADDLFVTGPSGAGYFYPQDWPSKSLQGWLQEGTAILNREDIHYIEVWNATAADDAAYASTFQPAALLLGAGSRQGVVERLDGTIEVTNVGMASTVAEAAADLQAQAGGWGAPTGPNLAGGVTGTLAGGAPAGSTLTDGGRGADFPAGGSAGLAFAIPGTRGGDRYQVVVDVTGSGWVDVAAGAGAGRRNLAYPLSSNPQHVTLTIDQPATAGGLVVSLAPYGVPARVQVTRLTVQAAARDATPRFVNLYVDAWKITPGDIARLQTQLGSDFHLVRLDQLLTLWKAAHPAG